MSDGLGRLVESLERSVMSLAQGIRDVEKERAEADKAAALERAELRSHMTALALRVEAVESSDDYPANSPPRFPPTVVAQPAVEEESKARSRLWVALAAFVGGVGTWLTSVLSSGSSGQ